MSDIKNMCSGKPTQIKFDSDMVNVWRFQIFFTLTLSRKGVFYWAKMKKKYPTYLCVCQVQEPRNLPHPCSDEWNGQFPNCQS